MHISSDAVCSARGCDKAGMQVLHILQTQFNRTVQSLCCETERMAAGSIALLTTPSVKYPARIFRFLPREPEVGSRLAMERAFILQKYQWLTGAAEIVCINPKMLHSQAGLFMNDREPLHDLMIRALGNFCLLPEPKVDPLAHLTPEQKKDWRKEQARRERRENLLC